MFAENFILRSRQSAHFVSTTACMLGRFFREENVENMLYYTYTCWNWAIWAYDWAYWIFGPSAIFLIWVFLWSTGLIHPVKFVFGKLVAFLFWVAGKIWELLQLMWGNRSVIVNWLATQANKVSVPVELKNNAAATPVATPQVVPVPNSVVEPENQVVAAPNPVVAPQNAVTALRRVNTRSQSAATGNFNNAMKMPARRSSAPRT